MLCAKYSQKDDIRVKKREAFEDGMEAGVQKKAVEAATNLLKMGLLTSDQIAQATGLSVEAIKKLSKEL